MSKKIEYLNLSKIKEGIIERAGRLGYIEMLRTQNLKDAIDTEYYENHTEGTEDYEKGGYSSHYVSITCMKQFNVDPSRKFEEEDND